MSFENHDSFLLTLDGIRPDRHKAGALDIHPYFGKVDPALVDVLISAFSRQGDVLLDPFCGSGTVLHEAILSGRSAVGWDSSPLATTITAAKLMGITAAERVRMEAVASHFQSYSSEFPLLRSPLPPEREIPRMPRIRDISFWFEPNALAELGYIRHYMSCRLPSMPEPVQILLLTAFGRIITAASNQQSESSYRKIVKCDYPGRVTDLFVNSIRHVCDAANRFEHLRSQPRNNIERTMKATGPHSFCLSWGAQHATILLLDSRDDYGRDGERNLCNLVVSSPPYLMSWDYGLYHKFRFYWLGLDLDAYEQSEIGRHLRRMRDDTERYRNDMKLAFRTMATALRQDAMVILINAPSIVHGEVIDTNAVLTECAQESGWRLIECVPTIGIPGPHHGMYGSLLSRRTNTAGQRGKREHVLIFRRQRP